ncbi:peptide-methionine (R)-S-oxide reductase [Candidatus Nomurabacteria bacterium RIFCSPLOWO2_02_FULL_44_12]|nr:MAG: peptide-methionine (R)-S-oxide reductase [Candidatus Nomurabacteria bacterium RIFCSPLOWO2_02_FULL_44_12]
MIDEDKEKIWKKKLTPEQYKVLREKGTEAPFSGKYLHEKKNGTYVCAACGSPLFSSDAKFGSNALGLSGWPSFDQALPGAVKFERDTSHGMARTEVTCAKCNSHLGHIFEDPEAKTGKRYCMNSVCLDLS